MTFEWIQCSFFLKKNINDSEITINLTPYHKLTVLPQEGQLKAMDVSFDVIIQFEKPLMYHPTIGWNWHKSWTIPTLSVEIIPLDSQGNKVLPDLPDFYAQVYIVKPIISREYSLCVYDLGLEGHTCFQLQNNRCGFTGLKFSATSYNNQGSKFHFLVVVYQRALNRDEASKIILSRISTPVFVDSRKSAREAELIKLKKLSAYIEPFDPGQLDKKFIKKESKKTKGCAQEEIDDNLSGLYNYFGAANIRNKSKHPIFLAVRFQSVFRVYVSRQALEGPDPHYMVKLIQESLLESYGLFQQFKPASKIDDKKVIFYLKKKTSSEDKATSPSSAGIPKKKDDVPEFLEPFQNQHILVTTDPSMIDSTMFVPFFPTQENLKAYQQMLAELKHSHQSVFKKKQQDLKGSINQNDEQNVSVQAPINNNATASVQSENQQPEDISTPPPSRKESVGEVVVTQKQDQKQEAEYDDSDASSLSSQSPHQHLRPDIPLKCQIVVGPLRKRLMRLHEVLDWHANCGVYQKVPIKCEKRSFLNDAQELYVLNQLMQMEIAERRELFNQKLAANENLLKNGFNSAYSNSNNNNNSHPQTQVLGRPNTNNPILSMLEYNLHDYFQKLG